MKIAIIQFPGSNCEAESARAIRAVGMDAEEFLWNRDLHDLAKFDGYFIVGGFSYEDRSRAGIVASLDPIMKHLQNENEKRKPILGVCNGAQILVEAGFVPGLKEYKASMALAINKRIKNGAVLGTGFYNAWVNMKLCSPPEACAFSYMLPKNFIMKIPVAHGEGRFIIPDDLLNEMKTKNLTTFRYCDENSQISDEFPVNPNGSAYNLAGVSNTNGNVLALMPHPERTNAGHPLFESMREYCKKNNRIHTSTPLDYHPMPQTLKTYNLPPNSIELVIESIITDNEAMTIALALQDLDIPVSITRKSHWEIQLTDRSMHSECSERIIQSYELFNPRKEALIIPSETRNQDTNSYTILVRYIDDIRGQEKIQILRSRYQIDDILKIKSGTLWTISGHEPHASEAIQKSLLTHIFHNQFSQECYQYER